MILREAEIIVNLEFWHISKSFYTKFNIFKLPHFCLQNWVGEFVVSKFFIVKCDYSIVNCEYSITECRAKSILVLICCPYKIFLVTDNSD